MNKRAALNTIAGLMAPAARTIPKRWGVDTIILCVLPDNGLVKLATSLTQSGGERSIEFFSRDGKNVKARGPAF